jgi:hypothetical protein
MSEAAIEFCQCPSRHLEYTINGRCRRCGRFQESADDTPEPPVKEGEQVKGKYRYEWLADGSHKIIGPDGPIAETYASYIKGESELRAQTIIDALNRSAELEKALEATRMVVVKYNSFCPSSRIPEETEACLAGWHGRAVKAEDELRQLEASRDDEKKALEWVKEWGLLILTSFDDLWPKAEADLRNILASQKGEKG